MLRGQRQKNERKDGGLGLAQGVEQVLVWRPEKRDLGVQPTVACLSFVESLAAHECLLFTRCRPHPVGDESGLSLLCSTCWHGPGFSPKSSSRQSAGRLKAALVATRMPGANSPRATGSSSPLILLSMWWVCLAILPTSLALFYFMSPFGPPLSGSCCSSIPHPIWWVCLNTLPTSLVPFYLMSSLWSTLMPHRWIPATELNF